MRFHNLKFKWIFQILIYLKYLLISLLVMEKFNLYFFLTIVTSAE